MLCCGVSSAHSSRLLRYLKKRMRAMLGACGLGMLLLKGSMLPGKLM
jgi:hypothetical protein